MSLFLRLFSICLLLGLAFTFINCTKKKYTVEHQDGKAHEKLMEQIMKEDLKVVSKEIPRPDRIVLTTKIELDEEIKKAVKVSEKDKLIVALSNDDGENLNNAVVDKFDFPYVYSVRANYLKKPVKVGEKLHVYARLVRSDKDLSRAPKKGDLVAIGQLKYEGLRDKFLLKIDQEEVASYTTDFSVKMTKRRF